VSSIVTKFLEVILLLHDSIEID